YDLDYNLISLSDPEQNVTTWDWTPPLTASDWNVKRCDPTGTCERWDVFNSAGLLKDYVDKRGVKDEFTYDSLGRLVQLDFNTTAVPQFDQRTLILKYDAANRTTLITDDEGPEYSYAYDQFDNATSETSKDGSVVNSIVTYSYDKAGRRKSFRARVPGTSSDTGTLSYQYSDADELLTILKNGVPLADLNYDPD